MIKFSRIAVTLVSCISLAVLGSAGAASAHPRHVTPKRIVEHVNLTPTGRMQANPDWCC
jgi:hypothetical protein